MEKAGRLNERQHEALLRSRRDGDTCDQTQAPTWSNASISLLGRTPCWRTCLNCPHRQRAKRHNLPHPALSQRSRPTYSQTQRHEARSHLLTLRLSMSRRSHSYQRTSQTVTQQALVARHLVARRLTRHTKEWDALLSKRKRFFQELILWSGGPGGLKWVRRARDASPSCSREADVAQRVHVALQNQFVDMAGADFSNFATLSRSGTPLSKTRWRNAQHTPNINEDWRGDAPTRKRRTSTCKVYSLLRRDVGKSAAQTACYCEPYVQDIAKLWFHKAPAEPSVHTRSCFDIWHDEFECGKSIPATVENQIAMRRMTNKSTRSAASRSGARGRAKRRW